MFAISLALGLSGVCYGAWWMHERWRGRAGAWARGCVGAWARVCARVCMHTHLDVHGEGKRRGAGRGGKERDASVNTLTRVCVFSFKREKKKKKRREGEKCVGEYSRTCMRPCMHEHVHAERHTCMSHHHSLMSHHHSLMSHHHSHA